MKVVTCSQECIVCNPLCAIEGVIINRVRRDTPIESLGKYLAHLINDTYKNSPNTQEGIKELAQKYGIKLNYNAERHA